MLLIDPGFERAFAALGLASCAVVSNLFPEDGPVRRINVSVRRVTIPSDPPVSAFYKQYHFARPSLRFWGRPSKAQCEYRNYEVFQRLQIPTTQRIACGEGRDWLGRLHRAFIITRAIPDALTLIDFFKQHLADHGPNVRRLRGLLIRQLASMTRAIHDAGFFHHDLFWRNILVTWKPPADPQLWWIDCPRGRFDRWSPFRERRRLRDLASLDKSAARFCSRTQRLRFIKYYLEQPKLAREARHLIHATLKYRRKRWPKDWH